MKTSNADYEIINQIKTNGRLLKPKKITVDKYGGFTFINSNADLITKDRIHDSIEYLKNHILNLYLREVSEFKVNEKFCNIDYSKNKESLYVNEINRIINEIISLLDKEEAIWKINSPDKSIYFCMHKDSLVNNEFRVGIIMIIFDNKSEVATVYNMTMDKKGCIHFDHMLLGPFYISKKDYYIEKVIKETNVKNDRSVPGNIIVLVYQCLNLYNECISYNLKLVKMVSHTNLEIKIFNKLMNNDDDFINRCVNIRSWATDGYQRYDDLFDNIISAGIPESIYDKKIEYPIVDFSKREWKFIYKYIDDKGIFDNDKKYFNLSESLEYPRYGKSLTMIFVSNNQEFLCDTTFEFDKKNNTVRFYIVHKLNQDITIFSFVDYIDINKFNPNENVISVETDIYYKKGSPLLKSIDDVKQTIPSQFMDYNNILDMMMSLISIHVVLFDRPDRSKMIKEIHRNNGSIKSYNKKSNLKVKEKSNTIIKHILMPTREAKDYVKSASNSNGEVYREYVMESWERRGYYRRIPNSDRSVWIEPTICKRHLELTKNKEIQIKL